MIKHLLHHQIDKACWDDCISLAANRRVYAFSWYLDIVCPGWEALVEDEYRSVFPLTRYRKWAVSYLAQPFFAQQLGIFSAANVTPGKVTEFMVSVPSDIKFIEIRLNSLNDCSGVPGEMNFRRNFVLDISPDPEIIRQGYSQNTRRNLKKGLEAGLRISGSNDEKDLIGLFRENYGRKEGKLNAGHYRTIGTLLSHCLIHKGGEILEVRAGDDTLSAGALFIRDGGRIYMLFAASAAGARSNGAMPLLIDHFIGGHSGSRNVLDFEGGNDPGIGRFYGSFGATAELYPELRINHLPAMAGNAHKLLRKLRK